MKTRRLLVNGLTSISILSSLVLVSPAYADDDEDEAPASGTFSVVSVVGSTVTFDFDGTLNGSFVCTQTAEVEFPNIEVTCSGTFTGSVNSASGTMQGVGEGSGTVAPLFTLEGEFEFSDGTGGLEDLEVELDFNQVGFSGMYSGEVEDD